MTEDAVTRKGIQVQMDVYQELTNRKGELTKKYAKTAHPREATYDDVLVEILGVKRK
jgi:hypothetical protein